MKTKFYTTKLNVDFEISTQFGPNDAISMIKILIDNIPAVKSVMLLEVDSDYIATEEDSNYKAFCGLPRKLK